MLSRILRKKNSGSVEEIENVTPSCNSVSLDSVIGPSVSTNLSSSPKKRNLSSTNSENEELKRQNINDSFLLELDNVPSDLETSATATNDNEFKSPLVSSSLNPLPGPDSSPSGQLAVPGMTVDHIRRAHRLGKKRSNGKPNSNPVWGTSLLMCG